MASFLKNHFRILRQDRPSGNIPTPVSHFAQILEICDKSVFFCNDDTTPVTPLLAIVGKIYYDIFFIFFALC